LWSSLQVAETATLSCPGDQPLELESYQGEGFSILLPSDWTILESDDLDLEAILAEVDGLDPDVVDGVRRMFEQGGKIFAFRFVGSETGFVDNINVLYHPTRPAVTIDGLASMAVQQMEDAWGATGVSSYTRRIPAGESAVIRYRLPSFGNEGISVLVFTGDSWWELTLSATDVDPLASDFDTMIESFRVTP